MRFITTVSVLLLATLILTAEATPQLKKLSDSEFPDQEFQELERYVGGPQPENPERKIQEENKNEEEEERKHRPNNQQLQKVRPQIKRENPMNHGRPKMDLPPIHNQQRVHNNFPPNYDRRTDVKSVTNRNSPRMRNFEPRRAIEARNNLEEEQTQKMVNGPRAPHRPPVRHSPLKEHESNRQRRPPHMQQQNSREVNHKDDTLEYMIGQKGKWLKNEGHRGQLREGKTHHAEEKIVDRIEGQTKKNVAKSTPTHKASKAVRKAIDTSSDHTKEDREQSPEKSSNHLQQQKREHDFKEPHKYFKEFQHERQNSPSSMVVASSMTVQAPQADLEDEAASQIHKSNVKHLTQKVLAVTHKESVIGEASNMGSKELDSEYAATKAFGMATAPNSFPPICKPRKIHIFSQKQIKCACHFKCHFECTRKDQKPKKAQKPKDGGGERHSSDAEKSSQVCRRVCTQKTCKRPAVHSVYDYKLQDGVCKKWRTCDFHATCEGKRHRWISYRPAGCHQLKNSNPHSHKLFSDLEDTATLHMVNKLHNKRGKERLHSIGLASSPSVSSANLEDSFNSPLVNLMTSPYKKSSTEFPPFGYNYMGYMPHQMMPGTWPETPYFYMPHTPFATHMSYPSDTPEAFTYIPPTTMTNWEDAKEN